MKTIIVKTQQDWDAIPIESQEERLIEIRGTECIYIKQNPNNSTATLHGNSSATLYDNSTATLYGNSSATLHGNSTATLHGNSTARLCDNSTAIVWSAKSVKKYGRYAAIVKKQPIVYRNLADWVSTNDCTKINASTLLLYKRVSERFLTQEETNNQTEWVVGKTLIHSDYNPAQSECGAGQFHACAKPFFCDQFRDIRGDKYIALAVKIKDVFVWKKNPSYPHKIAFRSGKVLYECDREGKKI